MSTLVTYNMQGGKNWDDVGPMLQKGGKSIIDPAIPSQKTWAEADIICLQECGDPPVKLQLVDASKKVWKAQYNEGVMYCLEWGPANLRCSLAVISRYPITGWRLVDVGPALRPLLGVKTEVPGRMKEIWVYSAHMPANNHNFASACAFDVINGGQIDGEYIIAGDFNCTPNEFSNPPKDNKARSWKSGEGKPICSPDLSSHQGGSKLDYAYSPNIPLTYYTTQGMKSDHWSVWFTF